MSGSMSGADMAAVYCSETKEVFQQLQSELEGPLHSNRGDFFSQEHTRGAWHTEELTLETSQEEGGRQVLRRRGHK